MPTKDVSRQYKEVQVDPLSPAPSELGNQPIDDIVEVVREWFFSNFEDPANSTPYNGREGGYQYIWGGPYYTQDVIENIFADELSEEQIEAVIDAINIHGIEWVPNSGRLQAPEEEDDYNSLTNDRPSDPIQLHGQMLRQIAEAEEQLKQLANAKIDSKTHGIGHNLPPEPIDDVPATKSDIFELRQALEALKAQPPNADTQSQQVAEAAKGKVQFVAGKITAWVSKKADEFVTEFLKELGKKTATATSAYMVWSVLGEKLGALASTVGHWLSSLHLPF